jgi:hypothetical protein
MRKRDHRSKDLAHRYGITVDQFDAMLYRQANACAICAQPFGGGRRPHVDHDHTTKRVRGLLCKTCNTALGQLGDSLAGLLRAAMYLTGEA